MSDGVGIDAHSGEPMWRRRVDSTIADGLAVSRGSVLACAGSNIYGLAAADGAVGWTRDLDGVLGHARGRRRCRAGRV
jgi:hypothetical protein